MKFRAIVLRGFRASHATLIVGLYFFLLLAPTQLTQTFWYSVAPRLMVVPGQQPDLRLTMLALPLGCANILLVFAWIFVNPLLIGGTVGRVRDQIEFADRPPASFGTYARIFYGRLLGSFGLLIACTIVAILPFMCVSFGMVLPEFLITYGQYSVLRTRYWPLPLT